MTLRTEIKKVGLLAALVLGAVSADAGATCWNGACDYKDSGTAGCRDGKEFLAQSATIKTSSGSVWGHVNLMYSPTCGAAWAYVGSSIGTVHAITAQVARQIGSGSIDSPYRDCFDCTARRSVMMGDASSNERARATGMIQIHFPNLNYYPLEQATTSWF